MINYLKRFIINNYKKILSLSLFLSVVYILVFMRFSTIDFDENYTLSLIKHNWNEIIYLTSLDVHPPLYYFVLKAFISIFTFWTSSLLVKIFAARLLSVIASIISWIFLCKIINMLRLRNNLIISWISFILLPTLLGYNFLFQQMTNVRMYALAGLFIIMEFYYLLNFRIKQDNIYLFLSALFVLLASYTQYYSAIIGGLLLFLYFIKYCLEKNSKNSIKLFFSGLFIIILYIPWMQILFNQMNNQGSYWIQNAYLIKQVSVYFACIILFLYPIFIYCKKIDNNIFKEQIIFILIILIVTFTFVIVYGKMKHPIFMFRYMYPILLIYEFIGISTMINLIIYNKYSKIQLCYYIVVFIILIFNVGVSFFYQIPNYNIPSIKTIENYKNWNKNKHDVIYITKSNVPDNIKYSSPNFINLIYSDNKSRFFVYDDFIKNNYDPNNVSYKGVYNEINKKVNIIPNYGY